MKAMILAAGKGERLKNINLERPKPLTPLTGDLTYIDFTIQRLAYIGIRDFIVNVHHLGEQIIDHLKQKYSNLNFSFSMEKELLGTGGGIAAAKDLLLDGNDKDFLVVNSDILHFLDLKKFIQEHRSSGAAASLLVKPIKEKKSAILFNEKDGFTGLYSSKSEFLFGRTGKESPQNKYCLFTGIQLISRELISSLHSGRYTIIKPYFDLVKAGGKVNVIPLRNEFWMDMGTPERMESARKLVSILSIKSTFSGRLDRIIINTLHKESESAMIYRITDGFDSWFLIMNSNKHEVNAFVNNSAVLKTIASGSDWILLEDGNEKLDYSKLVEFVKKNIE